MSTPAPFYSPIREGANEYADASPRSGGGCGCFRRFCFGWDEGGSHSYLLQGLHEETWLVSKLNKLKQVSEVVAGPRWKNFIRKIGRLCRCQKPTGPQFQYSPESYALNFVDQEEDGYLTHSFSTRFAPRAVVVNEHQKPAAL